MFRLNCKFRFSQCAAAVATCAAMFVSCSALYPVRIQQTGAVGTPTRSADQIEVFQSDPARPYVEVARLSTESVNYDNPGHAVARLRTVAAEQGADAIILQKRGVRAATSAASIGSVDRDFGFGPPIGGPSQIAQAGYSPASFAEAIAIRWLGPDPDENFTKIHAADVSKVQFKTSRADSTDTRPANPLRPEDGPFLELKPASRSKD